MKYDDYKDQSEESTNNNDNNQEKPIENQNHVSEPMNSHDQSLNEQQGYSGDNNINETEQKQSPYQGPKKEKKPGKRHIGFSAIIGGISGGVIAALTIIILLTNNVISFGNDVEQQAETNNNTSNSTQVASTVSDEDSVDSSIGETSKAVVGVSRLQQQSVWEPEQETGTGSGIVYKKENGKAYVVTNHHVVDGAQEIEITLSNDEKIPATVLGSDELADLAVLEVDGDKIEYVANLGSSEDVEVGETVIAIGNPLGQEFSNSLTRGIISGVNRSVNVDTSGDNRPDWETEVLQTDAAINPGNSGGALVDADGNVIGINSMKIAQQAVEGIGFAIPIDSAKPIMDQLETNGEVSRPYIGLSAVSFEEVPMQYREQIKLPKDVSDGIVVANVEQGSPAGQAGLEQFDVLTKINDEKLTSFLDLRKFLYSKVDVNEKVTIEYYHEGKKQTADLTLAERDVK